MAVQEKGLPTLTDNKSQQFKQTYFLYTRQQMDIHFSNAKHVVIQGYYGSGKSILGLKKLELIWKSLGRYEKIIYINFNHKSSLHFLMEKSIIEYVEIPSRKIKRINDIRDISESTSPLICVSQQSREKFISHAPGNSEIKHEHIRDSQNKLSPHRRRIRRRNAFQ